MIPDEMMFDLLQVEMVRLSLGLGWFRSRFSSGFMRHSAGDQSVQV
jgi:hypothetical protein